MSLSPLPPPSCPLCRLRFELQHGDADTQAAVLAGCVEAEPHYGERWTRVSKDLANAHQPTAVLLPKVVTDLETRPAP